MIVSLQGASGGDQTVAPRDGAAPSGGAASNAEPEAASQHDVETEGKCDTEIVSEIHPKDTRRLTILQNKSPARLVRASLTPDLPMVRKERDAPLPPLLKTILPRGSSLLRKIVLNLLPLAKLRRAPDSRVTLTPRIRSLLPQLNRVLDRGVPQSQSRPLRMAAPPRLHVSLKMLLPVMKMLLSLK